MKKVFIIMLILATGFSGFAQKENAAIARGNEAYRKQDYDRAEDAYEKALSLSPANTIAAFNLANAQFRNKKPDEAIKNFEKTAENTRDSISRAMAVYNKGVVLTREKKTEESIEAYKEALRLNPADTLARENLQRALREQQNNKKDQNNQKEKKQPNKLNKQQVMQLLQALQEQEKLLQQKLQQSKVPAPGQPEKDW